MNRRDFLAASSALAVPAASTLLGRSVLAADEIPRGKAEHCIFIWLGGGMGQIDTFDPKRQGDPKSTAKGGKPGSLYKSIPTAVPSVSVCEHLPKTANVMDRVTAVRTIVHRVVDEHAFATNLVHTGRMISGNVVYPSIGSIVAARRGSVSDRVPPYLLIGYPNVSRGPGFLGAKHGYVYLTDLAAGPAGFSRPAHVDERTASARSALLERLADRGGAVGTAEAEYRTAQVEALRLSGPDFLKHFDIGSESESVRASYGGEFGRRCLVARRLVEAGVRFIEVSHNLNFLNGTGWDVHNEGIQNQHLLIRELDDAFSALIIDLESRKLLDKTLIVIATEFGRPPEFDARGGRGHQGAAFSLVLAGGGLRHQGAYGVTDDFSRTCVADPVSIPDFHATILNTLGVDPAAELHDGARPVPVTDGGKPIRSLFG